MRPKTINVLSAVAWVVSAICGASVKENQLEEYERYVNEIVYFFVPEIEEKCHVRCIGEGGRMPHDVEEVEVKFRANRKGTIEEARRIIVTGKRSLLNKINAHEKIRPFLREYPFTPSRALISISFADRNTHAAHTEEDVTYVLEAKERIIYCRDNPLGGRFIHILEEPYEEAERIVAEEEAQGPLQFGPPMQKQSRSFFSKMFPRKHSGQR